MHTVKLEPEDISSYEGFKITSVARTIADVTFGNTEVDQVALAIRQSLNRGMTTKEAIIQQSQKRTKRVKTVIANILEGVKNEI